MKVVGAHHARMRKLADGDGGFEGERCGVQDPDFVIAFIANVELARDRMNGDARQESVGAVRIRLEGPFESSFAICVFENVHKP